MTLKLSAEDQAQLVGEHGLTTDESVAPKDGVGSSSFSWLSRTSGQTS